MASQEVMLAVGLSLAGVFVAKLFLDSRKSYQEPTQAHLVGLVGSEQSITMAEFHNLIDTGQGNWWVVQMDRVDEIVEDETIYEVSNFFRLVD